MKSILDMIQSMLLRQGYTVATIRVDESRGTIWVDGLEITFDYDKRNK